MIAPALAVDCSVDPRSWFKNLVSAMPDLVGFILEDIFNFYLKFCSRLRKCGQRSCIKWLPAAGGIERSAIKLHHPCGDSSLPGHLVQVCHLRIKFIEK